MENYNWIQYHNAFDLPEGGDTMKRKITIAFFTAVTIALPLAAAHAISYIDPAQSLGLGTADLKTTVVNIINWVLGLLGIIAVVMILYGGFVWLTASGNEENVTKAKNVLSAAIIGLVIILLAWAIINYVLGTTSIIWE